MKKSFILAALALSVSSVSMAQILGATVVCGEQNKCGAVAATIQELQKNTQCGVIYGEYVVKHVDMNNNVIGYSCGQKVGGGAL